MSKLTSTEGGYLWKFNLWNRIVRDSGLHLSASESHLLQVLLNRVNEERQWRTPLARLTKDCAWASSETVITNRKRLVTKGLLKVDKEGENKKSLYTITMPDEWIIPEKGFKTSKPSSPIEQGNSVHLSAPNQPVKETEAPSLPPYVSVPKIEAWWKEALPFYHEHHEGFALVGWTKKKQGQVQQILNKLGNKDDSRLVLSHCMKDWMSFVWRVKSLTGKTILDTYPEPDPILQHLPVALTWAMEKEAKGAKGAQSVALPEPSKFISFPVVLKDEATEPQNTEPKMTPHEMMAHAMAGGKL